MKDKLDTLKYLTLFITIIAIACVIYSTQKPPKCESILPNIQQACTALQGHIDSITKISTVYTDKIEQLSRDNERLIMENSALKDYIKGFDGFWKGDE